LAGLIVENTFTSIGDVVCVLFERLGVTNARAHSVLKALLPFYLTNHWSSEAKIGAVATPILFISGLKDELIPPPQMERLYTSAGVDADARKKMFTVRDGTHNDTFYRGGREYYAEIAEHIDRCSA
jgi:fermentation-respiration switch protein FrsA (DUF1100 family)